jgi:hypothetical protein
VAHCDHRIGQISGGLEHGARSEEFEVAHGLELLAQLLIRGDQDGLEGDDGAGLGFHGRVTGNFDQSDGFNMSISQLRGDKADTTEEHTRGVLGVDGVALA